MSTIKDGGPAFPVGTESAIHRIGSAAIQGITGPSERDRIYTEITAQAAYGMSLRDYFAAKALAGMLADPSVKLNDGRTRNVADLCYEMADAMLAAREKS